MSSKAAVLGEYEVGCKEIEEESEDGWEEEGLNGKIISIS